jgi:hypothetical protein
MGLAVLARAVQLYDRTNPSCNGPRMRAAARPEVAMMRAVASRAALRTRCSRCQMCPLHLHMRGGGVHLPPVHGRCTRHEGDQVRHPGGRAGGAEATIGRRDGPGADTPPHGGPGTALAATVPAHRTPHGNRPERDNGYDRWTVSRAGNARNQRTAIPRKFARIDYRQAGWPHACAGLN